MIKPHWRCDGCDSSRFKVVTKGEIKCYSCGLEVSHNTSNELL